MLVGLVINPIAGMGGKVGLKGTDGQVEKAIELGAEMVSQKRTQEFLKNIRSEPEFITCPDEMGEHALKKTSFEFKVEPGRKFGHGNGFPLTTADDTKDYVKRILKHEPALIVFAGGDGTARDVYRVVKEKVPVLGIPSGVKVYSSVFGGSPQEAAALLDSFLKGEIKTKRGEVMDIDEGKFRAGQLDAKLFGYARVPYLASLVPGAKMASEVYEEEEHEAIAKKAVNVLEPGIYIFGPGTTIAEVSKRLEIDCSLLGVDIVEMDKNRKARLLKKDANEKDIMEAMSASRNKLSVIVSPIGRQGFIFGRGNQQISENVLKHVDKEDVIILATQHKLDEIEFLRVDVSPEINPKFQGFMKVITSYTDSKIQKVI